MSHWLIWMIVVAVWTAALEIPFPDPSALPAGETISSQKFVIAKTMHVLGYAFLTGLSAWIPLSARYRWLMMLFLAGHAVGTELLQDALHAICHRGGTLEDVGFDFIGIVLGAAASWKLWTRADSPPS